MAKVVYNACHGEFNLSEAAVARYAKMKGIALYPERDKMFSALGLVTYWTVPPEERVRPLDSAEFHEATMAERKANSSAYRVQTLSPRDISRDDPTLAQVVEELGDAASGKFAKLKIADVPSGAKYRIDEYNGFESVMTPDDYDWTVAP